MLPWQTFFKTTRRRRVDTVRIYGSDLSTRQAIVGTKPRLGTETCLAPFRDLC